MILATGTTGFIGNTLVADLWIKKYSIKAVVRTRSNFPSSVEQVVFPDLSELASDPLTGI